MESKQVEQAVEFVKSVDRAAVASEFLAKGGDKLIVEYMNNMVAKATNKMLNAKGNELKVLAYEVKYSTRFAISLIDALKKLTNPQ